MPSVVFSFLAFFRFSILSGHLLQSIEGFTSYQSPPTVTAVMAAAAGTMMATMMAATSATTRTTSAMMAINIITMLGVGFSDSAWLVTDRNIYPFYVWLQASPLNATAIWLTKKP